MKVGCCDEGQVGGVSSERMIAVSWYVCDCPWVTKVCEEHKQYAQVPEKVLRPWVVQVGAEVPGE